MPSKDVVKAVTPIDDHQLNGMKRAADDSRSRSLQKRPMLRPAPNHIQHQSFKFLDLPPELRNLVYEYIMEYTHRRFPILHKTPKKATSSTERKAIPYIALTQTCLQIRAEFRPMWLSTHRLPFNLTDSYFKAFYPARTPKTLARFKPLISAAGALRIWVRDSDLGTNWDCCDVTRLFRHKARFPNCTITCAGISLVNDEVLRDFEKLLNHSDATWMKWVGKGRISQIRLGLNEDADKVYAIVVVKEKFAEPWMKALPSAPPTRDVMKALGRFGFEGDFWVARFSVDYS